MPEQQGAAASTTGAFSIKSFLIGAFTAAAIGGGGVYVGAEYGDDIKSALDNLAASTPAQQEPEQIAEIQAPPVQVPPVQITELEPPTQAELQTLLIAALDDNDRGAITAITVHRPVCRCAA